MKRIIFISVCLFNVLHIGAQQPVQINPRITPLIKIHETKLPSGNSIEIYSNGTWHQKPVSKSEKKYINTFQFLKEPSFIIKKETFIQKISLTQKQQQTLQLIDSLVAKLDTNGIKENWSNFITQSFNDFKKENFGQSINIDVTELIKHVEYFSNISVITKCLQDLNDKLENIGEDAQLANVDLQNKLQKQQQTLQMISTISKLLHDSAMAINRKIGG